MPLPIPRFILLTIMSTIILATSTGFAGLLPPLIDFQSVLLDEGGNLLPSGSTSVQFQILDENHAPVYTETQSVEVVKGATSALIGNGSDAKGISTGGIPDDIFATGAPRYLQVQVTGHAPEDPMTIVPVPYAQWSQNCASVADGGVTPASIAKAAVGFESLAPDVVSKLAEALSKSQGVVTMQALGGTGGASQVGVESKLINSGSSSVQGALQDIDLSVKKRQEETTFLTGKLGEEVTNRTNAIKGVQDNLNYEKNASNVGSLAQKINSEAVTRGETDAGIQGQITKILDGTTTSKISPDSIDFSKSFPGDLNMGGKKITSLGAPIDDNDAANQKFVNDRITAIQQLVDMGLSDVTTNQMRFNSSSYVGDGNSNRLIDTTGIVPHVLLLSSPSLTPSEGNFLSISFRSNLGGAWLPGIYIYSATGGFQFGTGGVKTFADTGFTVADNSNKPGAKYTYIVLGEPTDKTFNLSKYQQ